MRKIGELKGKPIIEGNPNEIKNNQIHYKESEGNINLSERKNGSLETISGSSSGGSSKIQYYKCLSGSSKAVVGEIGIYLPYIKCYEYDDNMNLTNCRFGTKGSLDSFNKPMMVDSIAFLPIEINEGNTIMTFNSFEEFINILTGEGTFKDNFESITEEEFYKID